MCRLIIYFYLGRIYEGGRIDLNEVIRHFRKDTNTSKYTVYEIISRSNSRKELLSNPGTPKKSSVMGTRKTQQATTMVELKPISAEETRTFGSVIA